MDKSGFCGLSLTSLPRSRPAGMAKPRKSTLPLIALAAMIEQADTTMRTVVDGGIG